MKIIPFMIEDSEGGSETVNFRSASFNVYYGVGNPNGTSAEITKYQAILASLNRVSADIITLLEISDTDFNIVTNNLKSDLSMPFVQRGNTGPLGSCVLSRFPITNPQVIDSAFVNAPGGGDEMPTSVAPFRCDITIGSFKLILYSIHLEPWCSGHPCSNSIRENLEFPRAIQLHRVIQDIQAQKLANPLAKIIAQGDFNDDDISPQTLSWASIPSGIRGSFVLGSDITFPVNYFGFPTIQMTGEGFIPTLGTDLSMNRNTIWDNTPNPAFTVRVKLDYAFVYGGLPLGSEVLNSENDANSGLIKYGPILSTQTSREASDHLLYFTDNQFTSS